MSQSVGNHRQRCQRVAMPEIADRPRPWLLQRSQFILFGAEVLGRGVLRKARISYYRNREGGLAKTTWPSRKCRTRCRGCTDNDHPVEGNTEKIRSMLNDYQYVVVWRYQKPAIES